MDLIPENAALGITLSAGGRLNIAFLVAIFISNFPESLASTQGMKSSGLGTKQILVLWSIAVIIGTLSTAIGYSILSYASPSIRSISIAFAAGAILVMLADTMIPGAFKQGELKRHSHCWLAFKLQPYLLWHRGDKNTMKRILMSPEFQTFYEAIHPFSNDCNITW